MKYERDYYFFKHNGYLWWLEIPILGRIIGFIFPYYYYQFINEDTELWWCGWFTSKVVFKESL